MSMQRHGNEQARRHRGFRRVNVRGRDEYQVTCRISHSLD